MFKVTERQTGKTVQEGDLIPDFRGEVWRFVRVSRGPKVSGPGRSCKVICKDPRADWQQEFYHTVFDLTIEEVEE